MFELGEKYEARESEKAALSEQQAGERKSVVKNLKSKQQEGSIKVPVDKAEKKIKSKEDQTL